MLNALKVTVIHELRIYSPNREFQLRQERDRLKAQIKEIHLETDRAKKLAADFEQELSRQAQEFIYRGADLDRQIHLLTRQILSKKLGVKTRDKINLFYLYLQNIGLLTRRKLTKEQETGGSFTTEDSAIKPSSEEIKAVYRRLVKAHHPDLATSEEDYHRRTEITILINTVYEAGDLDRLLAIEQGVYTPDKKLISKVYLLPCGGGVIDILQAEVNYLKSEYIQLLGRFELVIKSDLYRNGYLRAYGFNVMVESVEGVKKQVDELEYVLSILVRFNKRKMTVKTLVELMEEISDKAGDYRFTKCED